MLAAAGVCRCSDYRRQYQTVTTLYVTLNGTLTSPGTLGMWYEVFQGSTNGLLLDYGALTNDAAWSVTVRHLQFGTNVVVVSTQNAADATESASVSLNLVATDPPTVRPRPIPAEVWWGGLSQNSQLVDPTRPWNFVQKYEDGLYIHPVDDWGGMTTAQQIQLGANLKPFNTKFIIEASGNCPPDPTWPNHTTSRTAHGAFGLALAASEQLGFYFSKINENWGAGTIEQFAQLDPSWPMGDLVAYFTGDLSMVSSQLSGSGSLRRLGANLSTGLSTLSLHQTRGGLLADLFRLENLSGDLYRRPQFQSVNRYQWQSDFGEWPAGFLSFQHV